MKFGAGKAQQQRRCEYKRNLPSLGRVEDEERDFGEGTHYGLKSSIV